MLASKKILFKMSGSIACYKACNLISTFVKQGHEVQVACTKSTLNFVGKATLEGLTGKKVFCDINEDGQMMDHIHLIRWADLIVFAPATANSINSLANGLANDAVTTLFMAHDFKKPYYLAPAMNSSMLDHPTTQASLKKLIDFGVTVLPTNTGELACGETGYGRLLETDDIFEYIFPKNINKKSILITSGGTKEPIDGVRFISNMSTGSTGAKLADQLSREFNVTLLCAQSAVRPKSSAVKVVTYTDFNSLDNELTHLLSHQDFHAIVHAAAISDFSVKSIQQGSQSQAADTRFKINSTGDISIHLKKNPKIISKLKSVSKNKNIVLVGFKLTNTDSADTQLNAIKRLDQTSHPNFIVHNDLNSINSESHPFHIYQKGQKLKSIDGAHELAKELAFLINQQPIVPKKTIAQTDGFKLKQDRFFIGAEK